MDNKLTHLVVVDDDHEIRRLLSTFLSKHGYYVSTAKNGKELFRLLEQNPSVELIVLDVMIPDIDGIEICRRIRQQSHIPIIMLTAISADADRILGLELGADDYIAKPFNPRELLARIRAVLRRASDNEQQYPAEISRTPVLEFAGWILELNSRRLLSPSKFEVPLSSGVYDLLLAFLDNPQRVLSRDQLMDLTKSRTADPYDRSIDVQVSRLRQKLEDDPKNPQIIKTVRTGGYLFTAPVKKLKSTVDIVE